MNLTGKCHCGAMGWEFKGDPGEATACNCSLCHRLGTLWIYDYEHERVRLTGKTPASFMRDDIPDPSLEILFCPACACVLSWRGLGEKPGERRRMAVNIRLSDLESVAHLPIRHFEGFDAFEDLPDDGKTVRDYWF